MTVVLSFPSYLCGHFVCLSDCFLIYFSGDFLKTLEDPDLNVRRVALVTFNSAAHNKPSLIRELLDSVLPQLYNETKVRKELIREVRTPEIH